MQGGLLQPKLRFPKFNGEWFSSTLEEVATTFSYGLNLAAKEFDGKHKYIRITDIDEDSHLFSPAPLCSPDGTVDDSFKLNIGDIVFARTGASVGKTYLYNNQDGELYYAGFLIRASIKKAHPYFIYLQTLTENYKKWVKVMSMRSGQPGINAEEYKLLRIKLSPHLDEQQKIATFLTAVDKRITLLTQKKEKLEKYKKGVMQKIFNREIRFKDEKGNDYPEWKENSLKNILYEHKIRNSKNEIEEVFSVAKHQGVINQVEHLGRSYAAENISNYKVVFPNDIVYTKSPTSDFPFGIIKQNKLGRTGVVSVLYAVYTPYNRDIGYLLDIYFSSSINTYNYLIPLVQRGPKNTMNIGNDTFLKGTKILLPTCEEEQQKIATFLSTLDKQIENVGKQIDSMKTWKKGLLQQMFV